MALTYKLELFIKKIVAPVILEFEDGSESMEFVSGAEAYEHDFSKYYLCTEVRIENEKAVVCLKENDKMNDTNWIAEEQVSYF